MTKNPRKRQRSPRRRAGWNRREVLALGALGLGAAPARPRADRAPLRTPVCVLLHIERPILQAPMSGVTTPAMVAAVGDAGGLGILAGVMVPPEDLRRAIREVRAMTGRPFGVNLILHRDLLKPVDVAATPADQASRAQDVLNGIRKEMGLPASEQRPPSVPAGLAAAFEVILEEKVPVFSVGLGLPTREMVGRCRERGIKTIAMASTLPDARELEAAGVDAVVAQGGEAGGHRSTWTKRPKAEDATIGTMVLVRQAARVLKTPVIAAGGIMDGHGLVAALALGAQGALMGTRFIATRESGAPDFWKRALVEADSDDTTLSDGVTGMWARFLRNEYTRNFERTGTAVFPPGAQLLAARDIIEAARKNADRRYFPMYAGQGAGLIDDVPGAAGVLEAVMSEAAEVLHQLGRR